MSFRRPPLLVALATAVAMAGCPAVETTTSPFDDVLGTTTNPVPVLTSPNYVQVKGTVSVAGVASGLTVFLTDARVVEVPNAGRGTTDAGGKFTLTPAPSNSVWFAVAEVGGKKVAGFVVPKGPDEFGNPQPVLESTITEASTLAVAGILPLFLANEADPTRPFFLLRDLAADKFEALAAAIKASGEAITLQPRLGSLTSPFFQLKDKNAGVKAAYDALVKDLQDKTLVRGGGRANDLPALGDSLGPNAIIPSLKPLPSIRPPVGASATPSASASTGGGSTPTPTPGPVAQPSPRTVTVTTVDTLAAERVVEPMQMATFTKTGVSGVMVPASNVLTLSDLPTAARPLLGGVASVPIAITPAVDEMQAVLADPGGDALWTVARIGGERKVARIVPKVTGLPVTADAEATTITGVELSKVIGLAFSPRGGGRILALTETQLVEIDPTASGAPATVWVGVAGASGVAQDQAASASSYKMLDPRSLVVAGARVFFMEGADTARRIMEYSPGTGPGGSVQRLVGAAGLGERVDGPFAQARFGAPRGMAVLNANTLVVADQNAHVVRRVDLAGQSVDTYLDKDADPTKLVSSRAAFVHGVAVTGGGVVYSLSRNRNLLSFPAN